MVKRNIQARKIVWLRSCTIWVLACASMAMAQGKVDAQPPEVTIVPDAKVQFELKAIAKELQGAGTAEQADAVRRRIRALRDGTKDVESLVRQVAYAKVHEGRGDSAIWYTVILGNLGLFEEQIITSLWPSLDSKDDRLRETIRELFALLEGGVGFCAYRGPIIDAIKNTGRLPEPLIAYLVGRRSPPDAMELLARIDTQGPERLSLIDALQRMRPMVDPLPALKDPEPLIGELRKLVDHKRWWVRLYVTYLLRESPPLRTPEFMEKLSKDEHPRVRHVIDEIKEAKSRDEFREN